MRPSFAPTLAFLFTSVAFAPGCGSRTGLFEDEVARDGGESFDRAMPGSSDAGSIEPFAVGFFGTCFLHTNGTVGCFEYPTVGDGSPLSLSLEPIPGVEGATAIFGHDPFCARLGDGTVTCWSMENAAGDAGIYAAVPVAGLDHVTRLDIEYFGCAVRDDGSVWCWGSDDYNNLGLGNVCPPNNPDCDTTAHPPGSVVDVSGAVDVIVSAIDACARTAAGAVYCWGRAGLDDTADFPDDRSVPIEVPAAQGALALAMSEGSTIATLGDTFVTFGHPLGIEAPDAPTPISEPREPGEQVFGNRYDTFCRKKEGEPLHCTGGLSIDGQDSMSSDFVIPGTATMIGVDLATFTGCARLGAVDLLCWGEYFNALTQVHVLR